MTDPLFAIVEPLTPGVDPLDVTAVADAWAVDQPDRLAAAGSGSIAEAVALAEQARYGNPRQLPAGEVASWREVGYTTEPADGQGWPDVDLAGPVTTGFDRVRDSYDVVVIGSGIGSVAARVAAEAGARVLLVEGGHWLPADRTRPDALRNQRFVSGLETPAGPVLAGNPRVVGEPPVAVAATEGRWSNNAFTVGGGTRVFGAQAWRFSAEDFRMASTYGTPEGSALADWPITADDLAPWYLKVEHELGVSGSREGNPFAGTDEPYPMPPVPMNRSGEVMAAAAHRLGWSTNRVPLLINSVARAGRPACRSCGACVGFPCRAEAKNGTHNTALPIALATGNCTFVTGARAARITTATTGGAASTVDGVDLVDVATGARRHVRAGRVVLAAGAVESARLLLLSAHEGEPTGLGNGTDQVGRHLQAHVYPGAVGLTDDIIQEGLGPGPTVAVSGFRHGNPGIVGGGMLANDFVPLPQFTLGVLQRAGVLPAHGAGVHEGLVRHFRRHIMIFGPIQEVTTADARVRLADDVTDSLGLPVARLSGALHPEDQRTADFMLDRAVEWLEAAGCREVHPLRSGGTGVAGGHAAAARAAAGPSVGQHQAGTCRMGDDPASSVVNPEGRVWGHDNLAIADTSVHVTNGAVNPVLTGLALGWRTASLLMAH
ncbi:GMC family oxidoreductase [Aestuariimicrobium soli]|uniref:GMC family oxidoreductase n=1 Tax=Aestuariimicrobium soli TaxID=2035834 RepID=UPI003EB71A8E